MRITTMAVFGLLVACGKPEQEPGPSLAGKLPDSTNTDGNTDGNTTGDTDDTDVTDTDLPVWDCATLPPNPRPWWDINIQTEEDFDFDGDGYVLFQDGSNLVGMSQGLDFKIVASGVAWDPSGVQVLSTGRIIVGAQDQGALKLVDPDTGGSTVLIAGLTQPNGLEIGSDDRVYFTEFTTNGRVRWIDPDGSQGTILEDAYMPNGLVLSPDEQILYIGGHTAPNTGAILAIARLGPDSWEATPTVIYESDGRDFDAVEVDSCGNIYTVEYDTGKVLRITPDGASVEVLASVSDPENFDEFNSLRWGNGFGGWETDHLYLTNRNHIFPIRISIDGKPHPTM